MVSGLQTERTNQQTPNQIDNRKILIEYSGKLEDSIPNFPIKATEGKKYLIVTFNISNNGYPKFYIYPSILVVIDQKNRVKYPHANPGSYSLPDALDAQGVEVLDGGRLTASLAFLVPDNIEEYILKYDEPSERFGDYIIEYNK